MIVHSVWDEIPPRGDTGASQRPTAVGQLQDGDQLVPGLLVIRLVFFKLRLDGIVSPLHAAHRLGELHRGNQHQQAQLVAILLVEEPCKAFKLVGY